MPKSPSSKPQPLTLDRDKTHVVDHGEAGESLSCFDEDMSIDTPNIKPSYEQLEAALREIASVPLKEDPDLDGVRKFRLDGHDAAGLIRIARRGLGMTPEKLIQEDPILRWLAECHRKEDWDVKLTTPKDFLKVLKEEIRHSPDSAIGEHQLEAAKQSLVNLAKAIGCEDI